VVEALRSSGARVEIYDPLVTGDVAEAEFGLKQAASLEEAIADADCVAVLAGHDRLRDLDFVNLAARVSMPCVLIDGRAYYPQETIERVRALGFSYLGIGR
jgi:UDP-N-acetyl-D-mannosaminuronic acid dehydrogenase